jgi:hypothetical protein
MEINIKYSDKKYPDLSNICSAINRNKTKEMEK